MTRRPESGESGRVETIVLMVRNAWARFHNGLYGIVESVLTGMVYLVVVSVIASLLFEADGPIERVAYVSLVFFVAVVLWAITAKVRLRNVPELSDGTQIAASFWLALALAGAFLEPEYAESSFTDESLLQLLEPLPGVFSTLVIVYGVETMSRPVERTFGRLLLSLLGLTASVNGLLQTLFVRTASPTPGSGIAPEIDSAFRISGACLVASCLGVGLLLVLNYLECDGSPERAV
jgi:hypothetical protein